MLRILCSICVSLFILATTPAQASWRECGLESEHLYDRLPEPADVPKEWRFLAGGPWGFGAWRGVRCYTLALQSVASDGKTALLYGASGAFTGWDVKSGFGILRVSLVGEQTVEFTRRGLTYRFTRKGDVLHGKALHSNGAEPSVIKLAQSSEHAFWNVSRAGHCETPEPDLPRSISVSPVPGLADDFAALKGLWKGQVFWSGDKRGACMALAVRSISDSRFSGTHYWGTYYWQDGAIRRKTPKGSVRISGEVERTQMGIRLTMRMPASRERRVRYVLTTAGLEYRLTYLKGPVSFGILARVKEAVVDSTPTPSSETREPSRFRDSP